MGHILPAYLGEKPYICFKHFACRPPLPILIVHPSDAWLHNHMCSINLSYIKPVGINPTDASKLWPVLPLLPLVPSCFFAPTQRALLNVFPARLAGLQSCYPHSIVRLHCLALCSTVYLEQGWGHFSVEGHWPWEKVFQWLYR